MLAPRMTSGVEVDIGTAVPVGLPTLVEFAELLGNGYGFEEAEAVLEMDEDQDEGAVPAG